MTHKETIVFMIHVMTGLSLLCGASHDVVMRAVASKDAILVQQCTIGPWRRKIPLWCSNAPGHATAESRRALASQDASLVQQCTRPRLVGGLILYCKQQYSPVSAAYR